MSKPKLVLFAQEFLKCARYKHIFNTEFETHTTSEEEEFIRQAQVLPVDAAVMCFCFAEEHDLIMLQRLDALTGPLPVLVCSRILNPDFISKAAHLGADRFLVCDMAVEKIQNLIYDAIQGGGLKAYLESRWPGSLNFLLHVRRMITEIVRAYPRRLKAREKAVRLGISQRRLQQLCRKDFNSTFTQIMRNIWVYQALRLMQKTSMDNAEIASLLNYSETNSLARDFRKELGFGLNEARASLLRQSPEDLLSKI